MSNANAVKVTRPAMKERSDVNRAACLALNESEDMSAIKVTTVAAVQWERISLGLLDGKQGPGTCQLDARLGHWWN